MKGKITKTGYKRDSKDRFNDFNIIPSNVITMENVDFPILGISNKGDKKLMLPNNDYTFNGSSVTEFPIIPNSMKAKTKKAQGGISLESKKKIMDDFTPKGDSISNQRTYTRLQYLDAKNAYAKGVKPAKPNPFYDNWDNEQYAIGRFEKEPYESLTLGTTHTPDGNMWPDMVIQGIKAKNANSINKSKLLNPIGQTALYDKSGQLPINVLQKKQGGKLKKAQNGLSDLELDLNPMLSQIQANSASSMNAASAGITSGVGGGGAGGALGGIGGMLNVGKDLMKGFSMLKQEKEQRNQAKQFLALSELTEQAAEGPVDKPKRKYVRPEDQILDPNQVAPSYGTGSNFLAKDGKKLKKAQFGAQAGQLGNTLGSWISGGKGVQTGAGMVGGTIGSTVGKLIPIPGASAILGGIGGLVGGLIGGKKAKDTREDQEEALLNTKNAAFSNTIQNQYSSFMKNGGNMAMGGDLKVYNGEAEHMSTNPYLPEGGQTVMFKGPSHKEGGMPIKYGKNNVEVEGGEPAVQLKDGGKSSNLTIFGDMKIPSYGVSELNDPKAKGKKFKRYIGDLSRDEDKQNRTIVKGGLHAGEAEDNSPFDQLKISTGKAMITGADMKLKQIAQKKQTASIVQNAILQTAEELNLKPNELAEGSFKKAKRGDKIAQSGGIYPSFASKYSAPKEEDYIQPYGEGQVANDLSDFELMLASNRRKQNGKGMGTLSPAQVTKKVGGLKAPQPVFMTSPGAPTEFPVIQDGSNPGTNVNLDYTYDLNTPKLTSLGEPTYQFNRGTPISTSGEPTPESGYNTPYSGRKNGWLDDGMSLVNAALPFLRPSNRTNLDPNQLSGEMYALANNQQEAVQSQQYTPLLEQVSDISLQDQLNANQSDFNSVLRGSQGDPEAQASLAAQKYAANSGVLGQQFRMNQENKMGTYNRNRGVLNDATLKNLQILDQQYVRQSTAKSNTKAVAQQALNSIADKIAQNKLENRTLGVYENLYNYRFGQNGYAWNLNPLAQFNTQGADLPVLDGQGNQVTEVNSTRVRRDKYGMPQGSTTSQTQIKKTKKSNANGGIVKYMKSV